MSEQGSTRTTLPPPDYAGIRVPRQRRSQETVNKIKKACAELLATEGIHELNMRAVVRAAGVNPPTAYQYFDDIEAVVMSLLGDWAAEAYGHTTVLRSADEVPEVPEATVREMVEEGFGMTIEYFKDWPHFIELMWRNPRFFPRVADAIAYFNLASAADMQGAMWNLGVTGDEFTLSRSLFAVEMSNRMWQMAYWHSNEPDMEVVGEGVTMLVNYVLQFARRPELG